PPRRGAGTAQADATLARTGRLNELVQLFFAERLQEFAADEPQGVAVEQHRDRPSDAGRDAPANLAILATQFDGERRSLFKAVSQDETEAALRQIPDLGGPAGVFEAAFRLAGRFEVAAEADPGPAFRQHGFLGRRGLRLILRVHWR